MMLPRVDARSDTAGKWRKSRPITWTKYILADYAHTDFPSGQKVLDVGCGVGIQLRELVARGCTPIGVDVAMSEVVTASTDCLPAILARAEALPFRENVFDGALSKVVLMYTEESEAIREIARVVRIGGEIDLTVHGSGYYLRYVLCGPGVRERFYGARTLANTWLLAGLGRGLPRFLGDTVYDSLSRLKRLCSRNGLAIVRHTESPTFCGLPVFMYLRLKRVPTGAAA